MAVRLPILTCDGTPRRTKNSRNKPRVVACVCQIWLTPMRSRVRTNLPTARADAIALTRSTRIFRTRPQHFVSFFRHHHCPYCQFAMHTCLPLPAFRTDRYTLSHTQRQGRVGTGGSGVVSNLTRSDRSTDRSRTGKRVGIHAPVTGRSSRISPRLSTL